MSWSEQGPAGPAGASSLDALNGTACNAGSPDQGTLDVSYGNAGKISITCVPTTLETLTAAVSGGDGNDTVVSSPAGIDCGPGLASPACSAAFPIGYSVTLTAQPDGADDFLGWSGGGCSGTSTSCTVTMNAAASVTATFGSQKALHFSVANNSASSVESVTIGPPGYTPLGTYGPGISGSYQNDYADGTLVTITATLDSGSATVVWGGACAGDTSSTTCNVRMTSDQSVTLTFN